MDPNNSALNGDVSGWVVFGIVAVVIIALVIYSWLSRGNTFPIWKSRASPQRRKKKPPRKRR